MAERPVCHKATAFGRAAMARSSRARGTSQTQWGLGFTVLEHRMWVFGDLGFCVWPERRWRAQHDFSLALSPNPGLDPRP